MPSSPPPTDPSSPPQGDDRHAADGSPGDTLRRRERGGGRGRSPKPSWEAVAALAAVVATIVAVLAFWSSRGGATDPPEPGPGPICSNQGDGNYIGSCTTEFQRNLGPDPSEDEARDEAGLFARVEPDGAGPWPFFVLGTGDGLKVRTSGEADGHQIGSADDSTLVWVDCRARTGYVPVVLQTRDQSEDKWLRIHWPNTTPSTDFFESSPEAKFTGYVYEGFVLPAGHNGNVPDCPTP